MSSTQTSQFTVEAKVNDKFLYLDTSISCLSNRCGSVAHQSKEIGYSQGQMVRSDVIFSGFLFDEEKANMYQSNALRIWAMWRTLSQEKTAPAPAPVQAPAPVVGNILSMWLATGPVARLWMRALYQVINTAV